MFYDPPYYAPYLVHFHALPNPAYQPPRGLIVLTSDADEAADGDTFTITTQAGTSYVWEWDDDASVTPGNILITIPAPWTVADARAAMLAAIALLLPDGVTPCRAVAGATATHIRVPWGLVARTVSVESWATVDNFYGRGTPTVLPAWVERQKILPPSVMRPGYYGDIIYPRRAPRVAAP